MRRQWQRGVFRLLLRIGKLEQRSVGELLSFFLGLFVMFHQYGLWFPHLYYKRA